jgi:hypothetical protein
MNASSTDRLTGRALFVYYKIDQALADERLPLVQAFQRQVRQAWPDLSCELMQRPAASAQGQLTWMEIYRTPDGVSDAIIAAITLMAEKQQLPMPRLSEIFIPLQ